MAGTEESAAVSCASQQQVPNMKSFFTDWKDETHKDLFLHVYNGATSKQERTQLLEMAILWDHFDAAERALDSSDEPLDVDKLDLSKYIECTSITTKLVKKLLDKGVDPNARKPLDAVFCLEDYIPRKIPLIKALVEKGAEIDTGAFFKMVELALKKAGEPEVKTLQIVCSHFIFPEDGKVINDHGQTPWHLAMDAKRKHGLKICEILCKYPIDPTLTDQYERRADNKLSDSDKRLEYFKEAERSFMPPQIEEPMKSKRKRQRVKKKISKDTEGEHSPASSRPKPAAEAEVHKRIPKAENTLGTVPPVKSAATTIPDSTAETWTSVTSHLLRIMSENERYFSSSSGCSNKISSQEDETDAGDESNSGPTHSEEGSAVFTEPAVSHPYQEGGNNSMQDTNKEVGSTAEPTTSHPDQDTNMKGPNEGSMEATVSYCDQEKENHSVQGKRTEVPKFDGLMWEVECTEDVLKFLGNKKTPPHLRRLAIQKISRIADGEFPGNTELCKSVSRTKGLELYEAKLTKSDRILWGIAIHYSKRCRDKVKSNSQLGPHVYSEVIRIWKIVLKHDRIHHGVQQIEMCVKQIEKAHDWETSVSKDCITPLYAGGSSIHSGPNLRSPRIFVDATFDQHTKDEVKASLCPPATPEGNLLKLYNFSSSIAHSILEHSYDNIHRKYPFKEWREEHDIIQMPDSESILLVGRSGTGKTTCCLYRMMNQFCHWSGDVTSQLLLPRAQLSPMSDTKPDLQGQECHSSPSAANPTGNSETDFDAQLSKELEQDRGTCSSSKFEYLHQVFVSKNYVLCAEMKKQFNEMTSEGEHREIHTLFKDEELPHNFSNIDNQNYPLFLTARRFFLLLDNSISGEPFFPRDKDGSLKVKIQSYDYDYGDPDAHVDLQLTDSESEDEYQDESEQHWETWREVTASYFVDKIWPIISGSGTELVIDPLLVWMEINSFIKGSREALEKRCGYLDQKEYEELGKKMAPYFSGNRKEIYKLFQKYKKFLQDHRYSKQHIFDECEFVHNLYQRLDKNVPWSIHVLYVDEVQDFTQAELSLLLSCCRCPNGHFMTGDTAQCIMRGISFRFKDLKTIFYNAKMSSRKLKSEVQVTDPKLKKLTINFRSDSGVLRLAASVVDILAHFFPASFDSDLPHDRAMFDKPESVPVLLQLCGDNTNDLAVIMYGNRRDASNFQFGAHQAVIVQSEKAKQEAKAFLSGNILTIYEAKGLEFDDVLLYNFFKYSKVKDAWRVVTSFLNESLEKLSSKFTVFKEAPHPLKFEEMQHKSLCVELKYLYTAITRAKHKLWIYDSDEDFSWLPMFDYWQKRGLAKVISVDDIGRLSKGDREVLFPVVEFKREDWKKQGDYFSEKRHWELAKQCYQRAGTEVSHLEKEANGYFLVKQAEKAHGLKRKDTVQKLYLQATLAFLECDQLKHDVKRLKNAAICLMNGKKYREAAELFERLSEYTLAFKGYKNVKDVRGCIRVKEKAKDYSGAVRYQMSLKLKVGLALAAKYVRQGVFEPNQQTEEKALYYAKRYAQKKDKERLLSIIDCIVDVSQRVSLLKQATLFVEASELLVINKQYQEAFRILSAQGEHRRGIELADKLNDDKGTIRFVLQSAVAQLATDDRITDSCVLEKLEEYSTHADPPIKAKASLLLGKTLKDSDPTRAVQLFRKAYDIYKSSCPNMVGEIESFKLISELRKFQCNVSSMQFAAESVETSRSVIEVASSLRIMTDRPASAIHTVHRAEEFYGFQKVREVYFLPQDQVLWLEKLKLCSSFDEDGMMKLDEKDTLSILALHLEHYILNWVEHNETLTFKLSSFTLYMQLVEQEHLTHFYRSCPSEQLIQFLDICFVALELEGVCKSETFLRIQTVTNTHQNETFLNVRKVLLRTFSFLNMLYLPLDRNTHFTAFRKSDVASRVLKDETNTILKNFLDNVKVDDLLQVWKLNNILGVIDQSDASLRSLLKHRTNDANRYYSCCKLEIEYYQEFSPVYSFAKLPIKQYPQGPSYPPPYAFIYNPKTDRYEHFFFFWIESCKCIRQGKVITAIKMSMDHFICVVVRRRSLRANSVANLVNILSVYATALYATLSFSGYPKMQHYNFIVPHTFRYAVENFDELNCQLSDDQHVLVACAWNVQMAKPFKKLKRKAFDLLWRMLEILLGKYCFYYHVLRHAVRNKRCIESSEAIHCLVLALTLLGNMALVGYSETYITDCRQKIYDALKDIPKNTGECGQVLMEARGTLANCTDVRNIFRSAILKLLARIDGANAGLLRFKIVKQQQLSAVKFDDIPPHCVPQGPLISKHTGRDQDAETKQLSTVKFDDIEKPLAPLPKQPAPTHSAKHTADTPPNPASPKHTAAGQDQGAVTEQYIQEEDPVDPEEPQLTPDLNRTTSFPGTGVPEQPEIQDDDVFDDEEINDILDAAEKIEIVPDSKAEEEIKGDESRVDKKFCIPCGEPISASYEAHCESEDHQQNSQLYDAFEVAEKQYSHYASELERMLEMCQAITVDKQRHSLEKITIAITIMLRKTGERIEEIKRKYDWKQGKSEIEKEMTDKMKSLFEQGEAELESEVNKENSVKSKGDVDSESESDHDEGLHIALVSEKPKKGNNIKGTSKNGTKKTRNH